MTLSPFSKPTIAAKERWIKNRKAAELLGVDERTIKRWMRNPAHRKAIGAVSHKSQWRIESPKSFDGNYEWAWMLRATCNLKELGVDLKPNWQRELERIAKGSERNLLETFRLWLAAHLHLSVKSSAITKEDTMAILLLWQTACEILEPLPRGTRVDKLKSEFSERLKARHFADEKIRSILSYWPDKKFFKLVHAQHTLEQLEKIRSCMDYTQAMKTCENLGKKPTEKNLRQYLHKDIIQHINDTRDEPPKGFTVLKIPTAEEFEMSSMATVYEQMQGRLPLREIVDFSQSQNGLKLRTFRKRYPRRKSPQTEILATVYKVRASIAGAEKKQSDGKTAIRDSKSH